MRRTPEQGPPLAPYEDPQASGPLAPGCDIPRPGAFGSPRAPFALCEGTRGGTPRQGRGAPWLGTLGVLSAPVLREG